MGMSRLRKVNWLAQGFTAKEWLNLEDDPRSPASQAGVHPEMSCLSRMQGPVTLPSTTLPDSLPAPQSLLHLLLLGWAVLQPVLWAPPAPGARFPGSCGRASFAWSSGSSWPASRLMFSSSFPLMTLDSLKALVSSSSCESLLLSL